MWLDGIGVDNFAMKNIVEHLMTDSQQVVDTTKQMDSLVSKSVRWRVVKMETITL